jgi:lipoprotein-anchoring transpeptidase ErfK/SrfK
MEERVENSSHKVRTGVVASLIAVLVVGLVTVGSADRVSDSHGPTARELQTALAASVRFTPSRGAKNVPPDAPIAVASELGHLARVRVRSTDGSYVNGRWDPATGRWKSDGVLAYDTVYRVTATVTGATHLLAQTTTAFRTLAPTNRVSASVFPTDGMTVGVGQPIVFTFSQPVPPEARAALAGHIIVKAAGAPVVGGWHWFNDHELHYRPKAFWPQGRQVTVLWALNGWNAGGEAWGDGVGVSRFTIGDAHVSIANLATFQMAVTDNGRVVATYPISGGKPTDPTMGGTHIVLDRASVVRMNSATNGVPVNSADGYDELVYDDVHISDSGEYVHAAPWSVNNQGNANVSHGCINLSPTDAKAFFDFSQVGDVVLVTGGPRPPAFGDHGVMDWSSDWAEYTPTP